MHKWRISEVVESPRIPFGDWSTFLTRTYNPLCFIMLHYSPLSVPCLVFGAEFCNGIQRVV